MGLFLFVGRRRELVERLLEVVVWIKGERNFFLRKGFSPRVFVSGKKGVEQKLRQYGIQCRWVERLSFLEGRQCVLEVVVDQPTRLREVVRDLEGLGCEVFHGDLPVGEEFLFVNGLFPLCGVEG